MHKRPTPTQEVRRVVFQESGQPVHVPVQVQNAGNDAHMGGQQGQPAHGVANVPHDVIEVPENVDEQGGQQPMHLDNWVRRSTRPHRAPDRFVPSLDFIMLTDCDEPSCFEDAISRADNKKWQKAMKSEMDSLISNDTWELVHLPKGKKPLPNKWVFKLKITPGNAMPKYKARLVAKGFKQQQGVDFEEIFSPMVKMTTLRVVLGLVVNQDLDLVQMDVKTAFLHGDLHEDIYMQQPEGFVVEGKEAHVCKLKKSLYGLKQAPRQWYQKFDTFMHSQGFRRSELDHCLYTKKAMDGSLLILILYVDDMLFAGRNSHEMNAIKKRLHETFDMKDLGDANHILGMRIQRDRNLKLLFLSQSEYVGKVLNRFNMEKGKPISTPLPPYVKLSKDDCPTSDEERACMSKVPYEPATK